MKLVFGPEDRDAYTLRKVWELNLTLLFECRNCERLTASDFLELVARYGTNATIGEVRRKAVCGRCGKREADVLLRSPGSRDGFMWWPRPPRATR